MFCYTFVSDLIVSKHFAVFCDMITQLNIPSLSGNESMTVLYPQLQCKIPCSKQKQSVMLQGISNAFVVLDFTSSQSFQNRMQDACI